jgi:hypothetical protein
MSKWDNVRNRRDERVKRNRAVVYFGQPMRIANTDGDGVLLRSQRWVHVPEIDFELSPEQKAALRIIKSAVRIASDTMPEGLWNEFQGLDTESVRNQINRIVSDMMRNYNSLGD